MKHCKCTTAILSLLLLAIAGPSFAQDSWLPSFREGTSVYLAPTLPDEEVTLFNAPGYTEELKSVGSVNDLQIYVVVTRNAGSKLSEENKGPALVRKLWESWNNNPSFNESRALVILMTAPKDGPLLTIGVRAGSYLNGIGINRDTMNEPTGPVFTAKNQYLSTSPARVPLSIAEQINTLVAAATEAKPEAKPVVEPEASPETNNTTAVQTMNIFAIIGFGALLLVGILFFAIFCGRNNRKSSSPRSEFENRLRTDKGSRSKTENTTSGSTNDVLTASAAAAGGFLLAEQLRKKPEEQRKSTDNTSSGDSSTIVPAVISDSTTTPSGGSTCSTPSSCGGGSSCSGGGGCGGGCGS